MLALAFLSVAAPTAAAVEVWRIDPVHTQILFSIDHQGFNQSLGLFKAGAGTLWFDPDDWSTARLEVSVDTGSLLLGDAKWEETVRSWRFLDTGRWPQAHYRSIRVERQADGSGLVHGEFELHGRKQPLDIAFTLNKLANDPYSFRRTAGFSAGATFRRSDYGMDKVLSAVGDTVTLRLEAAFVRDRGASDEPPPIPTEEKTDAADE
ncbi:YceI family protein [Tahibacter caeni]|uniref:YceI family protein n=1 Tax=Tahibacter caeni TaxID=1453545 RepID=UPI002147B78B|nr:YceI family protein [Tahibacter caeni]